MATTHFLQLCAEKVIMAYSNQFGLHFLDATERLLALSAKEDAEKRLEQSPSPAILTRTNMTVMPGGNIIPRREPYNTGNGIYDDIPDPIWSAVEKLQGSGSHADPLGGLLLREWRTGAGPDVRYHGPRSRFSDGFASSTGTGEHMLKIWEHWLRRKEGDDRGPPFRVSGPPSCHRLTNWGMGFDAWQFMLANPYAHDMGSVTVSEVRYLPEKDKVLWTGWNIMGTGSFMGARLRKQLNVSAEPVTLRRPGKFGAVLHILRWYRDVPSWVRAREQ
jgi:hypothetical protein